MVDYMRSNGFTSALEAFSQEAGVAAEGGTKDLLEKKWTSVVRLQKKARHATAQFRRASPKQWTAEEPPLFVAAGCRS